MERRLRAPFCGFQLLSMISSETGAHFPDQAPTRQRTMKIDGQCHCGMVSYEAEIDPELVSICHCTDCQALTGSPYRVTVICSAGAGPDHGQPPKIYGKRGETAACASSISAPNAVPRCSPAASREGPTISAFAGAASASATSCQPRGDLVPLRRALDQRFQGFAGAAGRSGID